MFSKFKYISIDSEEERNERNQAVHLMVRDTIKDESKGSRSISPVIGFGSNGTAPQVVYSRSGECLKAVLKCLSAALRLHSFFSTHRDVSYSVYKGLKVWLEIYQLSGFDFSLHPVHRMVKSLLITCDYIVSWYSHKGGCSNATLTLLTPTVLDGKPSGLLGTQGPCLSWIDFFKYKNAAFYSYWMGQELPSCPGPCKHAGVLIGGVFHQFVRSLARIQPVIDSFALSILMSKKGMPRATDEMVKEAESKHIEIMTKEKSQDVFYYQPQPRKVYDDMDLPIPPITLTSAVLRANIRRTVREMLGRSENFSLDMLTRPVLPSLSSNYNYTCSKLGTFGLFDERYPLSVEDLNLQHVETQARGWVSQYYDERGVYEELENEGEEGTIMAAGLDFNKFHGDYRRWYWGLYRRALGEEPLVKPVGLKEALKIRCITKGPPLHYFVLKPIQKLLWGMMQKFWNFELTGSPITETLINQRFGRPQPGSRMHSGDYKSATDELHSWASEVAIEELILIWERQCGVGLGTLKQLMMDAMTQHAYGEGPQFKQKRGQLMGSIISFPFLCIANVSLMRCAYELAHGISVTLDDLPCWVNGDDCLTNYQAESFPLIWEGLGKVMGFQKSVGKTYDSETLCSVNSRFFRLDTATGWWNSVPFINMGLLKGVKRSAIGDNDGCSVYDLGSYYTDLLECGGMSNKNSSEHIEQLLGSLKTSFVYNNRNLMNTFKGPWHMPIHLCGLGIPLREPTRHERVIASQLAEHYNSGICTVPTKANNAEFKMQGKIRKMVREYCPLVTDRFWESYESEGDYGDCYIALAYRVWYCQGLKGLVSAGSGTTYAQAYAERLWHVVSGQETDCRPCDDTLLNMKGIKTIYPLVKHGNK